MKYEALNRKSVKTTTTSKSLPRFRQNKIKTEKIKDLTPTISVLEKKIVISGPKYTKKLKPIWLTYRPKLQCTC